MRRRGTSNIERRTSNLEGSLDVASQSIRYNEVYETAPCAEERLYDLEDRLLEFAAAVVRLVERLPKTRAGNHVAGQLLRSGTSPLPNHGEAESAESPADFIHKLKVCLKELRETKRWLRLVIRIPLLPETDVNPTLGETIELIRIFRASVRTAESRVAKPRNQER